jgi:hypothetical protein
MPRPRIDAAGLGGSSPMGYGVAGSNLAVPAILKAKTEAADDLRGFELFARRPGLAMTTPLTAPTG